MLNSDNLLICNKNQFPISLYLLGMYTKLPNGQIIYEEDYSCVLDPINGVGGIFIGNLEAAQNIKTLKKHSIRAVLTAAKGVTINHPKAQVPFYLHVPGEDRDGFDLTRYFSQAISFIRDSLENTNIMVHCLAGVSRSVCLVLAFLIKCKEMSYQEAYDMVKARRKIIHPNDGFISQLKKFQLSLDRATPPARSNPPAYHQKGYSVSPTKRRYEYFTEAEEKNFRNVGGAENYNKPERPKSNFYESPSKYIQEKESHKMINNYIPTHKEYESPVKRSYLERERHTSAYQPNRNNYVDSPSKYSKDYRREVSPSRKEWEYKINSSYSPSKNNLRRLSSYEEPLDYNGVNTETESNSKYQNGSVSAYRSPSSVNIKSDSKRLFGDNAINVKYGIGEISPTELSEELDRKIAKIRQKYSEYTKDSSMKNKLGYGRQSKGLDENDFYGAIGMKKITSDIEPTNFSKMNPEIGSIRSTYMKGSGMGLRRLTSLKEGYY